MARLFGRFFVIVAILGLATAGSASAQVAQAQLRGSVVDESGAAVPGVAVTATHIETGTVRETVTSATGAYVMPALPVGTYRVTAALQGFGTIVREGFRLAVGESVTIDFTLKVAAVEETVTVTGESPLVDARRSDISGRIEPAQVESLPLNGRNWLDLVALVPGARGNPGAIQAGASGSDMAKYQVDGVDVTNQCCGGSNQGYSQENISEFQVLTNRFDAEYGRVGGAVINAITKSGTNQIRGTGFGFFRNDRFDAKNFYTNKVEPFDERQYGANGGGPIVKDRAHFFASYEYQNRKVTTIPNTKIPEFDKPYPQDITRSYGTARVDAQLSTAHRLFLRGSYYNWEQINLGVGGRTAWSGGYSRPSDNLDASVGDTWVISDRMVYEVRAGFSRIDNRLLSNAPIPLHSFPSVTLGSPTNSPQWWKEMNLQVNQSVSYFIPEWRGAHSMRAGLQLFRPHFWGAFPQPAYGNYNFDKDPTDFSNPATYPKPTSYSIPLGDTSYDVTNWVIAAFYQDNWTISRNLTVNLGIRYDVETGTVNADLQSPIEPGERRSDKNNVSPRAGFAYDLRGDGRTVIRGGFGRYYDKVMLNLTSNERRSILGELINVTVINPVYGDPLGGKTYEDYYELGLPRDLVLIENYYQTPRNDQVSVGVAQQIGQRFAVQADYVHSDGRLEPMTPSINFFEDPVTHLPKNPTIYARPYPQYINITMTQATGKSKYDALQVGFNARRGGSGWSSRLQFQGSYTLSSTWDNHASNRGGRPTNPFNLDDEWSYSGTDQRHRIVANAIFYMPWDIQLSAIYFAGSERPINVGTSLDPFRSGSGRWLDAAGNTLPRYSERTEKWDRKLDLRLAKTIRAGRVSVQLAADVFNVLNTKNLTSYGTNYFSLTYLKPANSTDLFYQPRQVQLGFRVSF